MSILIVDDSSDSRMLLATILKKSGYGDIKLATSASESFRLLHGNDVTISLILMDIMMPGMNGIEACHMIKSDERFQDIPIIMVTAKTEKTFLRAAFDAGAIDYITKPFNKMELLARVKSALALKSEMDIRKEREREIARIGYEIQKTLLLEEPPRDFPGLDMAVLTIPSQRIDGDFYDFIPYNDSVVDIIVADVMGKGIPAAMLGAATKNQLFRAVNRIIIKSDCDVLPEPEAIVNMIHEEITEELIRLESFVTLFYIRLNTKTREASFINCGHTSTLHFRCGEERCMRMEGDNVPLGFSPDEAYLQQSVAFNAGDLFVFYSDGITEAKNDDDEYFGIDRLERCIERACDLAPAQVIEAIREAVTTFSGRHVFSDDVTCVIVKIKDGRRGSMEIRSTLSQLAGVRTYIEDMCSRHELAPLDDSCIFELTLAVHEALVNVIQHGMRGDNETIGIDVVLDPDEIEVYLCYHGSALPLGSKGLPRIEDMQEGGYGMCIIEEMTDRFTCSDDGNGKTCVMLAKTIKKKKFD